MEEYIKALCNEYFDSECNVSIYTDSDAFVNIDMDNNDTEYWVYGRGRTLEDAFVSFIKEFYLFLEFDV